jgi:BON domain
MQVSLARRVGAQRPGDLAACALLGFGAGLAAGFLFSEVFGTDGHRRIGRLLRRRIGRPGPGGGRGRGGAGTAADTALVRVREALASEPALGSHSIEVRPRGNGLELRGWVASRSARATAYRRARAAAGTLEVTNHVLVRGEDDAHTARPSERLAESAPPAAPPRTA